MSELRMSPAIWAHSVTCHPTQVNVPRLKPGRYSIHLFQKNGRLSWPTWLCYDRGPIIGGLYWDGLPVLRQKPWPWPWHSRPCRPNLVALPTPLIPTHLQLWRGTLTWTLILSNLLVFLKIFRQLLLQRKHIRDTVMQWQHHMSIATQ